MVSKKESKNRGFKRLFFGLIFVGFLVVIAAISYRLSGFYGHLDRFNLYVEDYDGRGAQKELGNLKAYHQYFSNWKLGYFADRFLLPKMHIYEAETAILNDDCDKAFSALEDHQDDFEALNLKGICQFKVLYEAYSSAAVRKDPKLKDVLVQRVVSEVAPTFKACVENGPGPETNFNCSYNYDLVSNPRSAQSALEGKMPGPKLVLGRSGQSQQPGKSGPGDRRLDPGPAGQGQLQRKG